MNKVAKTLCVMGSRITLSATMHYPFILQRMSFSCKVSNASHCHLHHSTPFRNPTKIFSVNLSNSSSSQCWKCGRSYAASQKFCPSCNTIQPIADQVNHFELLGLKPDFNIDAHHLSNLFKNLQRLYHPDKFSAASEEEQELSAQHSSRTNKAYQTLLHPLSRAEYLLQLSGMVVQEADTDLDQEFLTTVMELNEELMEAETEELLAHLKQRVLLAHDLLLREMGEAFSAGRPAAARPLVARAKYYSSLLHKIRHQERERGIAD